EPRAGGGRGPGGCQDEQTDPPATAPALVLVDRHRFSPLSTAPYLDGDSSTAGSGARDLDPGAGGKLAPLVVDPDGGTILQGPGRAVLGGDPEDGLGVQTGQGGQGPPVIVEPVELSQGAPLTKSQRIGGVRQRLVDGQVRQSEARSALGDQLHLAGRRGEDPGRGGHRGAP